MAFALDPRSVAVAVASRRNAKLAALYFDYFVPIYCDDDVPSELFPPAFGAWTPTTATDLLRRMQQATGKERIAVPIPDEDGTPRSILLVTEDGEPDLDALEYVNQWAFLNRAQGTEALRQQMHNAKIARAPVLLSGNYVDERSQAGDTNEVTAVLSCLPLVDIEPVSWQQILEYRKDAESRNRLRILRLHLADQFIGKSREQIAAGLQLGIEQCERAAKKHGFSLFLGSLQASCESKETLCAIGVWGLVGTWIGGTTAAAAAGASVGVALEIARLSLTIAKGKSELSELHKYHPYSYVLGAKRELR